MTPASSLKKHLFFNLKLSMSQMVVSNVHLGHTRKFLNINIKPYLLGRRSNIYILNVAYTVHQLKIIFLFIINLISIRQNLLLVKDRDVFNFKKNIKLKNVFFFDKKWIGGILTNYRKVRQSIKFKKENTTYNSLLVMRYLPSLIFFFDPDLSHWALKEASNLNIPISAVIDTNILFLKLINYPIVGNNKSFESLHLYLNLIRQATLKGRQKELLKVLKIV